MSKLGGIVIKLGLIGKDISHSKSQSIYEGILKKNINYTLFDFGSENELPSLDELFQNVEGVSITAPYKKAYASTVEILGEVSDLGIINCIRKTSKSFEATNTDYLAIKDLVSSYDQLKDYEVLLLGDGSMAEILKFLFHHHSISYKQISRKQDENFHLLDFKKYGSKFDKKLFVINSCARAYTYTGLISDGMTFWDLNYDHDNHKNHFTGSSICYIDGMDLLRDQALQALKFWGINY